MGKKICNDAQVRIMKDGCTTHFRVCTEDESAYMNKRFGPMSKWPAELSFASEELYRKSYKEVTGEAQVDYAPMWADLDDSVERAMGYTHVASGKEGHLWIDGVRSPSNSVYISLGDQVNGVKSEREKKMARLFEVYIVSVSEQRVIFKDAVVGKDSEQAKMKALTSALGASVAESENLTDFQFFYNEVGVVDQPEE